MEKTCVALSQRSLLYYVKEARKNLIWLHMLCECKTEVIGHQQVTVLTHLTIGWILCLRLAIDDTIRLLK